MKNLLFSVFFLMISSALWAFQPEMKTITLNDGEKVLTRLCLPEGPVKTIVFAIHGTGPNTYLNGPDSTFMMLWPKGSVLKELLFSLTTGVA